MQRGNKNIQPLKLQSYKLDSEVLASKINELNELKSELESSLSNQKMKESNVVSELQNLKIENQKLRANLSNSQFTKKTQTHLIEQLQNKLQSSQNKISECLKRIDVLEKEKKQLSQRYEAKQEALKQSQAKFRACEEKLMQITPQSLEKLMKMGGSLSSIEEKPINSGKKIKKLKKPSVQMQSGRASVQLSEKYLSGNVIVQRQEDSQLSGQDVYLQMIRQLFRQLNKIDISPRELFKIPQIEAFARLRNPSMNDLIKLLTVYPFNLKQASKIELIYQFMEEEAARKGKILGGRMVIQQIIGQIEEVEGLRAARSFCQSSSLHSQSVIQYIGSTKAKTQPIRMPQQMPQVSIESNIELQSDNSSYF